MWDVVLNGPQSLTLRPRLSSASTTELALLQSAIQSVQLQEGHDVRLMASNTSTEFKIGHIYNFFMGDLPAPPLNDVSWHGRLDTGSCPFCPGATEDANHLFISCARLGGLWDAALPGHARPTDIPAVATSFASLFAGPPGAVPNTAVLLVLWVIWKSRNSMIFEGKQLSLPQLIAMINDHLALWVHRASKKIVIDRLLTWCSAMMDVT
ncbi:hypothetical protein ACP70R_042679 [Stipagrostis hirtigluma subsp. patula]